MKYLTPYLLTVLYLAISGAVYSGTLVTAGGGPQENLWDKWCEVEDPMARYPIPAEGERLEGNQKAFYSTPYDLRPGMFTLSFTKGLDAADETSFTGSVNQTIASFTYKFVLQDPALAKDEQRELPGNNVIDTSRILWNQLQEAKDSGKTVKVDMDVEEVYPEGQGWEGTIEFLDGRLPVRVEVLHEEFKFDLPEVRCRQYGKHVKQSFDIYYPDGFQPGVDEPLPMYVFVHGGGWNAGDKMVKPAAQAASTYNEYGVAVVAIGYRYVTEFQDHPAMKAPVAAPLLDVARALQYIRYHAEELGLNPDMVNFSGGSAGGATTCWIAMHDDMADPESPDPIARMSTRITSASPAQAQTSIDPQRMREWIPSITYGSHSCIPSSEFPNDVKTKEERFQYWLDNREKYLPIIKDFSAYRHATSDDPPMYHNYGGQPLIIPAINSGNATHHPMFGKMLHERLMELGVESYCVAGHPDYPEGDYTSPPDPKYKGARDFVLGQFGIAAQ